jgi:acetyl esterase/lipase
MRTISRFSFTEALPTIFRLLVLMGSFLSIWIVIPAPIYSLLPLSVGTPEISPGLVCLNVAILILGGIRFWLRYPKKRRRSIATLCCIVLALSLSASPLMQFAEVQQQAERALAEPLPRKIESSLGRGDLLDLSPLLRAKMRSNPLILGDLWHGIPRADVRIDRNIPFARPDGQALCLDIYRPAQVGNYPGIISIYGGAWQRGSPKSDDNFNRYIAAQGYVVWAISYRRMAMIGRSAGAQLAMLAAYTPTPFPIRAVVNYYGPVDLTAGYDRPPVPDPIESRSTLLKFLGGTPTDFAELYRQASPINAVKPGLPASLLIYGGKDRIIEAKYGKHLAETLRSQGNRATFIEIPWADHAFDAVFNGLSNQLALYYTERFLARELLS